MVGMPRLTFALGMAGVGRIVLAGPTPVPLLVGAVVTAIFPIQGCSGAGPGRR